MEDITRAEKAALYFQILERCEDWKIIYQIAIGEERFNNLGDKSKVTSASRWKSSHRIQKAREEIERNFKAIENEIREKAIKNFPVLEGEPRQPETKKAENGDINFLDPDEFMKFASQKANELQDEKDRRAYLEMIAKLMNYKDKDQEEQEQIRAYLPETCENCELYKRCSVCSFSSCPVSLQ